MKPVEFSNKSEECQYALAQRIWQILTGYVMFKQDISDEGMGLIHYADLAELLGYDHQASVTLEAPLENIYSFCEQNCLPYLNIVVVKFDNSIARRSEILSNLGWYLREQNRVKQFDWFRVGTPMVRTLKKYSVKNNFPEIVKSKVVVSGLPCNKVPSSSAPSTPRFL